MWSGNRQIEVIIDIFNRKFKNNLFDLEAHFKSNCLIN